MSDPAYHHDRFWDLPCSFLESVLLSLQDIERDRIQSESVTAAYLTDSLHAIAHAVYGSKDKPYHSNPAAYLPGFTHPSVRVASPTGEEGNVLKVDDETIRIFVEEMEAGRIDSAIVAHFSPLLPGWLELVGTA